MKKSFADILRRWMLPAAMASGISLYLLYHSCAFLRPVGPVCHAIASNGQMMLIGVLLFFQFVKVSPHDLRPRRWHLYALCFQAFLFLGLALTASRLPQGSLRILVECGMLCLICPTASAAGVITDRLGGDIAGTVTYLVIANLAATFLIPMVIPMVQPSATLGFWPYVLSIASRIFPVLILPCLLAWLIRYTAPKLQRKLMRWAPNSFYVWGVALTLAMTLATRALVLSRLDAWTVLGIIVVSMAATALQFFVGRGLGKAYGPAETVTSGQSLGQKNTGFLIWLGYNYLTPVTSVAGGLYAIWQNLFNSWELWRKEKPAQTKG